MIEPMTPERLEQIRAQTHQGGLDVALAAELLAEVDRARDALARVTDERFTERLAETLHYAHGYDDYGVANEAEVGEMMDLARPVLQDIQAVVAGEERFS